MIHYDKTTNAQKDAIYYYLNNCGEIHATHFTQSDDDTMRLAFGNCFKTHEEAEQARDLIKDVLSNLHKKA